MSFKEVGKLRKEGKLDEALALAQQDLDADNTNIWSKRAIAWVYFAYLKESVSAEKADTFLSFLDQLKELSLPAEEEMIFDSVAWNVGKLVFELGKGDNQSKVNKIFELIKDFPFPKPKESYSFLFKAFHRVYKATNRYIEFADWWDFENFKDDDFLSQEYNGTKQLSIVEQAYIAYVKSLFDLKAKDDSALFGRWVPVSRSKRIEALKSFLPKLDKLIDAHPEYQYPPFYKAKILLDIGDVDDFLANFVPFARKKMNDFWVWDLLGEGFSDKEIKLACLCKAVSLKSPEKFLGKVRMKLVKLLIEKELYDEAKCEVKTIVKTREENGWRIAGDLKKWLEQPWFKKAKAKPTNADFYRKHIPAAEEILYSDIEEEVVVVEFVNKNKSVLNFIKNKKKHGFFKYDRFLRNPEIGDVLKVRFGAHSSSSFYKVYTVRSALGQESEAKRSFSGVVGRVLPSGVGFVDNVFLAPGLVKKYEVCQGDEVAGVAILSYNKKREEWGWKAIEVSGIY